MSKKNLKPGDDLEMIKSVEEWPHWPILPLKKAQRGDHRLAVLIEAFDGQKRYALLEDRTMFEPIYRKDIEHAARVSAEEVIAAGWIVD